MNSTDLQRRADLLANKLRGAGDHDGEMLVFELCRTLRDREGRLHRIKWALEPE